MTETPRHRTSPVLVARESELVRLRAAVTSAAEGRGRTVSLIGPPGVGKSALARALVDPRDAAAPIVGRAAPAPASPLRAVSELALAAVGAGADVAAVERTIYGPALALLLGGAVEPSEDLGRQSLMVGEALRRLLETVGACPVVCVLEDLHWADDETLQVLDYLVDHVIDSHTLVVTTIRDEGPSTAQSMIRRWVRRRVSELIEVRNVDRDAVAGILAACLEANAPPAFVDAVMAASEGNPFLVEEFLDEASARGALEHRDGAWIFESSGPLGIPATFMDTVDRRVRGLAPADRELVQLAALLGRELDPGMLERLGAAAGEVRSAIDAATRSHLAGAADQPGEHHRFRHALTQDAVAATLAGAERRRLAARALDALERDEIDDQELESASRLAQHAGDTRRSCAYLIDMAARAVALGATATAMARLDAAEAYADADALHGAVIREYRVQALAQAGEAEEALRIGEPLVRDLEVANDRTRLHRVQVALARASGSGGDWAAAAERLDHTWPNWSAAPNEVLSFRAIVAIELGQADTAERLAREAASAAAQAGGGVVECEAHEVLGRVARERSYAEAAQHFRAGVDTASRHGLGLWRARSLLELGLCEATLHGRADMFESARDAAVACGALSLEAMVDYNLANLHGFRFEPEAALRVGQRCVATAEKLDSARLKGMGWAVVGQARALSGERAKAWRAADEAIRAAPDDVEIEGLATGMCRGFASIVAEDGDAAVVEYTRSLELLRALPYRTATAPWYVGPLLLTLHDERGVGADLVAEATSAAFRGPPGLAASVDLARAVVSGRRGDAEAAERLARAAVEMAEHPEVATSLRGFRHLLLRLTAEAALADGWGEPIGWLSAAESWFAAHGYKALARGCASQLRDAGVAPRRRGRGRVDVPEPLVSMGVTARELEVLSLLTERLTNREIAEQLTISPRTVKTHVEHLLTKTSRRNRVELAELAREIGLG